MEITRNSDANYWLPTENEWYKAAYYDPNKPGGAGYWNYPTASSSTPSNQLIDDTARDNNANFFTYQDGYTIGSPYWMTEVGAFENSASPYGTFDQGGNVAEWIETAVESGWTRGLRGGYWQPRPSGGRNLRAAYRGKFGPAHEFKAQGFRVASNEVIPEPGSIVVWFGLCVGRLAVVETPQVAPFFLSPFYPLSSAPVAFSAFK